MSFSLIIAETPSAKINNGELLGRTFDGLISKFLNKEAVLTPSDEISKISAENCADTLIFVLDTFVTVTEDFINDVLSFHQNNNFEFTLVKQSEDSLDNFGICICSKAYFEDIKSDISCLTDIAESALKQNKNIGIYTDFSKDVIFAADSSISYTKAASILRERIVKEHAGQGVVFMDFSGIYIDADVVIGENTVIYPCTYLRGKTKIGKNCVIYQGSVITDSEIADCVTVTNSVITESFVDSETRVGPFAYIRPNTHVGKGVKVGDFVELKNSNIGDKTSISHLTYIGDSDVGSRVNFGCGTITVNYDGKNKFRTTIGDHAFVGCNTNLISPVKVGDHSYIAAGSTITEEVPEESLAIARARQVIKTGWKDRRND